MSQLTRSLSAFEAARQEARPQRGWLRAIREGLGLSLEDVGKKLGQSRRRIQEFEKAESKDRITLRSLRRVAAALDCELVYAIVPKSGTITELAERRARAQATEDVLDVEHTMALENQATGNVKELIEEETKRRLKKQ
ncbi:MAG: helix-turn-helix domain-containing protein [Candidatus Acidiferrum sp.]